MNQGTAVILQASPSGTGIEPRQWVRMVPQNSLVDMQQSRPSAPCHPVLPVCWSTIGNERGYPAEARGLVADNRGRMYYVVVRSPLQESAYADASSLWGLIAPSQPRSLQRSLHNVVPTARLRPVRQITTRDHTDVAITAHASPHAAFVASWLKESRSSPD